MNVQQITHIAFDADDTLWVNEPHFNHVEEKFEQLLTDYVSKEELTGSLYATERKNLEIFGYGAKGFMLSMIETALELTEGKIPGTAIQSIIDWGKALIQQPIDVLPDIPGVLDALKTQYTLLIITKGDLFDQESKIARSGLADHFEEIEIVSEKKPAVYQKILTKYRISPAHFLMIGNSLKSDILPTLEIGANAVHIPYHTTWVHEQVSLSPEEQAHFHTCSRAQDVLALLKNGKTADL